MKNTILHWTSVLLASAALMLSGCTSSDEETPEVTTPVFPELASLTIPAGETFCEVTFTPNMDWTVSIPTDAETSRWFKLSDGVMESTSISGRASSEPVTVQVTTIDQESFDLSPVCEVSLTMGGQTKVIAQVTRGTAAREFELYLSKYSTDDDDFIMPYEFDETPLTKYDGTEAPTTAPEGTAELKWPVRVGEPMQVVKGSSNFDWLISAPEWIEVSSPVAIDGEADSKQFFVTALFSKLTDAQLDGAVALLDIYDSNIADVETPGANAHNRYCFTLPALRDVIRSNDQGATFSFNGDGYYVDTNGTVLTDQDCTMDITSANGLKFYVVAPSPYGGYEAYGNDWVTITPESAWDDSEGAFQSKRYTIKVGAYGANRTATILALPQTVAASINTAGDLNEQLLKTEDGSDEIKDELKPYIFATIEQEVSGGDSGDSDEFLYYNPDMADRFTGPDAIATLTKLIPGENEQFIFDNEKVSPVAELFESGIYDSFAQGTLSIYTLTCTEDLMQSGDFDESTGTMLGSIILSNGYNRLQVMPDNYATWITSADFELDASHRALLLSTGTDNAAPKGSIAAFVFEKELIPGMGYYQKVCILFVIRDYGTESANQ